MTDEHETYELDPNSPPVPKASEAPSPPVGETLTPEPLEPERRAPSSRPRRSRKPQRKFPPRRCDRSCERIAWNGRWQSRVAALALYIAGCMAGQLGVTPNIPDPSAVSASGVAPLVTEATKLVPQELGARMIVAMKGLLRVGVLGMCLVAGAYFLQLLDRRPIGDVRALLARTIAISAIALLVLFVPFESLMLKRFYDVIVPLGVVWLAMIPFFRISPRDSGVILLGALMALTVLSFGSMIVSFAVG